MNELSIQRDVEVADGNGEDNITDQQHPDYDIHWYGANLSINELVRRFNDNKIQWPDFQRQFVWHRKQASRLIQSILIGLPIPSIFLYQETGRNGTEKNPPFIIDGLQRMMTFAAFKNGKWPDVNPQKRFDQTNSRPFQLTGLSDDLRYEKKTYEELDEDDKGKFDNTLIHILFIEQRSPDDNRSSAFHIFERLNSGGTPLQPQEMRNALYKGSFRDHLYEMSHDEKWAKMFGPPHKQAKDQELILRFLALFNREKDYKPPMKIFLNDFMNEHKDADKDTLSNFSNQFNGALERIHDALGDDAFKPHGVRAFSAPYFDSFMVAVAGNENASSLSIKTAYQDLKSNEDFQDSTRAATTNADTVKKRLRMVKEAING